MTTHTLQEVLNEIKNANSQERQLISILDKFVEEFPVMDAFLFRYSYLGFVGEGIISINSDHKLVYLNERDDIRSLPTIETSINERKAMFYTERELFEKTSSRYVIDSGISSFLIVPITFGTVVIGYIYSTQMDNNAKFDKRLLDKITNFGKSVGEILQNGNINIEDTSLSRREIQVMKKIALGETTIQIGDDLGISELTVKQYVKQALRKLEVHNRAQGVAELFRKGVLF